MNGREMGRFELAVFMYKSDSPCRAEDVASSSDYYSLDTLTVVRRLCCIDKSYVQF
jgi:hypothetical protein